MVDGVPIASERTWRRSVNHHGRQKICSGERKAEPATRRGFSAADSSKALRACMWPKCIAVETAIHKRIVARTGPCLIREDNRKRGCEKKGCCSHAFAHEPVGIVGGRAFDYL